ncbi:hypothetical protein MTO96_021135 [Rhipicephalus appendiculatus]
MTLLVLGCALPQPSNWYPFFVVLFYVLSPLPTLIARRYKEDVARSSAAQELAYFITTGIVISAFGLPLVLARSPAAPHAVIQWSACGLQPTLRDAFGEATVERGIHRPKATDRAPS